MIPAASARRAGPLLLTAATVGAALMAVLLARHAVFLAPLNVDEELTIRLADFSFGHIFHIVSTQRGGGPLHFWLEHFLLGWWPSLQALRLPSLVFFCLALPAVALVARDLVGAELAAGVVLLLAAAPVPESYATFGRPHTMLFAWLMWATAAILRAARTGSRPWWIAGGLALGTSVFVHPTAPLYAITAFGGALVLAARPWRAVAREAWPGLVALVVGFLPYYLVTLHVLSDRYGLGNSKTGRTFDGKPVWEDALGFLAPGRYDVNYLSVLCAVGLVALLVARRYRVALFCAGTVIVPVVFFSVVPANGTSALFFDRYVIPTAPAFLVLVVAGCAAIARWAGPLRLVVLALLVGGLLATEIRVDVPRQNVLRELGLDRITHVVRGLEDTVVFGASGSSNPDALAGAFTFGRPAPLLNRYLSLRIGDLDTVDDDSCARLAPFLLGPGTPRHGLWIFYAAAPDQEARAAAAFAGLTGVTVSRPVTGYFLLRSRAALPPRALVLLGRRLRLRWQRAVPENTRVEESLIATRQALAHPRRCPPYGVLDDPNISPHWPPLPTQT
jgi:4-amino-4-deoxy-L-arabinose transferase-like glycosyltransferase